MNPLYYGPVRLSECLAHPEGYYTALGFTGILAILDSPTSARNLALLHNREPALELIPELGLGVYPASVDQAGFTKWLSDVGALLDALKPVGIRQVALNTESESAPNQNVVWKGHPDQAKAYGKQWGKLLRDRGLSVALEGIPDYEDPQLDPKKGTFGKNSGFVPFCRAALADVFYYTDQGEFNKDVAKANAQAVKLFGCKSAVPEVWPRLPFTTEAEWTKLGADLAAARATGAVCVVPPNCGDAVLDEGQVARLRNILRS